MRMRRTHSREFKLQVVRQIATGEKRPAQICREYDLADSVLHRWRREYDSRGEAAFSPRNLSGTAALDQRIADLERLCGQLALENRVLKKALSNFPSRTGTR
jgi:transposase-like protein